MEKTEFEFREKDRYSEELIAGYIREILVNLNRLTGEEMHAEDSIKDSIMQNAIRYITENYSHELSLSMIAESFSLSESHFSRQFKFYTGFGVDEYISTVREKMRKSFWQLQLCLLHRLHKTVVLTAAVILHQFLKR